MQKHGAERRRQWRKLQIGIDAQNMQIRSICVTSNNIGFVQQRHTQEIVNTF
jgi:hypothetical protein